MEGTRGDSGNVLSWSAGEERRAQDLSFLSRLAESHVLSFPPGDAPPRQPRASGCLLRGGDTGCRNSAPRGRPYWIPQLLAPPGGSPRGDRGHLPGEHEWKCKSIWDEGENKKGQLECVRVYMGECATGV